jgi:hypothetical protein
MTLNFFTLSSLTSGQSKLERLYLSGELCDSPPEQAPALLAHLSRACLYNIILALFENIKLVDQAGQAETH